MERLDKFLCDCGIGTRSQVKAIIKAGRVTVDGVCERDNNRKIDPITQTVALDAEPLNRRGTVVVMLNKPAGFVTATEDKVERTVMELLPAQYRHLDLKPVGRLDK
ncbi:MAG: rRNA pseudouridine synthase, partial [Oscillospiraceae bacterium]|nr:rRNA pseudouridine synthase [Oscillospiraceae bacterium]